MRRLTYRPELDGIRAIAALLVFFYHSRTSWVEGGYVGVGVFFVLSGYLITTLIRHEIDATGRVNFVDFAVKRAARLYPALLLFSVGAVIIELIRHNNPSLPLLTTLTYTSNVPEFREVSMGSFLHTWTLSIEEQFYLLWPVLAGFALMRRRWLPVILGAFLALLFIPFGAEWVDALQWSWRGALGLPLGCALAIWHGRPTTKQTGQGIAGVALGALLVGAILDVFKVWSWQGIEPIGVALCGILIYALTRSEGWLTFLLSHRWIVWLGQRSYGFYLWHIPVLLFLRAAPGLDALPAAAEIPLGLVGTTLAAWFSFRFVEQPVQRKIRGMRQLEPAIRA